MCFPTGFLKTLLLLPPVKSEMVNCYAIIKFRLEMEKTT